MKWTVKEPKHGDTRIIRRFLFVPRQIGEEVRWLCFVNILQRYEYFLWTDKRFED
jgi:hypothetical protein